MFIVKNENVHVIIKTIADKTKHLSKPDEVIIIGYNKEFQVALIHVRRLDQYGPNIQGIVFHKVVNSRRCIRPGKSVFEDKRHVKMHKHGIDVVAWRQTLVERSRRRP